MLRAFSNRLEISLDSRLTQTSFNPNSALTLPRFRKRMSKVLGNCKIVDGLGKYLGSINYGSSKGKKIVELIKNNMERRLQGWKSQLLSQVAKATLIQSTLSQIPLYHLHRRGS